MVSSMKMTGIVAVCVLLLTGCGGSGDSTSRSAPVVSEPVITVTENVSYRQVLALNATSPDANMAYGEEPLQTGDLWMPADVASPPLVIVIHGGCWSNQYGPEQLYPLASALQEDGFAVWVPGFRRNGDDGGGWPGTLEDVVQSINYIYQQNEYPFDESSVTLAGHSSGGHLALLASQQITLPVARITGLAPITDIVAYSQGASSCQQAVTSFMGSRREDDPQAWAEANPVNLSYDTPLWILAGEQDITVTIEQNPIPEATFVVVERAGHFDWIHPDTPAFQVFTSLLAR